MAVLGRAPVPALGARLTLPQIRAALKRGGRRRNLDPVARKIQKGLRGAHLAAPGPVEDAFGATVGALVRIIAEANRQIADLQATLETRFEQHPDAVIYHSQPRLGTVLGARALDKCSGTTPTVTPAPSLAETTPERRPSQWRQAANTLSWPATSEKRRLPNALDQ